MQNRGQIPFFANIRRNWDLTPVLEGSKKNRGLSPIILSYGNLRADMGHKYFLILGAVNAFLAVGLGAFGAHGLKARLSLDMLGVYQTGVQYHFYHALGLLLVGMLVSQWPTEGLIKIAGWVMFAGIVIFSGSLYLLSITGIRGLGAITPIGGLAFLVAWLLLVVAFIRLP